MEKAEADQLARLSSLYSVELETFFFLERGVDFEAFVGITRERTGRIAGRQFSGERAAGKNKERFAEDISICLDALSLQRRNSDAACAM